MRPPAAAHGIDIPRAPPAPPFQWGQATNALFDGTAHGQGYLTMLPMEDVMVPYEQEFIKEG